MLVTAIGLVAAMSCEGCTFFAYDEYAAPPKSGQIVLAPSQAMLLAAPGPLGQVNVQPITPEPLDPYERLKIVETILDDYGVHVPQTPAGASYALVGGGDRATPSISLNGTLRTDPIESTAWSASPVLRIVNGQLNAQRVSGPRYARETVGGEVSFSAPSEFTGLNFDIGLVPRATIATEGDFSVRRIGAEFRFGQDIDQRGTLVGLPSWYLFAGADGEAVIFNNSTADGLGLGLVNGLQLRDQVTVGDMQAGVSLHKYGTNFTFSYIRREVDYRMGDERFDLNEDFGGITLSWRR